jgi:hypothetical protein
MQEIANTLNTLSKWPISANETPYQEAIEALVHAIPKQVRQLTAQDVSNSLNALSKWNLTLEETSHTKAILSLIQAIPQQANTFNMQAIGNTLNTLSKWPISPNKTPYQEAIFCLVSIIPEKITTLCSQSLADSLNALAKWALPIKSAPYRRSVECLLQQINTTVKFSMREAVAVAFALCLLKFTTPEDRLFENNGNIIRSLFERGESDWFGLLGSKAARQIYQINLYQKNIIPNIFLNIVPTFTPEFQSDNLVSSQLQKSVFTYLSELNPIFVEEYFIQFTHVDMASPENKIALQVNGPSHYQGKVLNISSQFNNYLLEKLGWSVVVIPHFEWNNLPDPEKRTYLRDKLSAFLEQAVSHQAIESKKAGRNKTIRVKKVTPDIAPQEAPQAQKLFGKKKQKKFVLASPEIISAFFHYKSNSYDLPNSASQHPKQMLAEKAQIDSASNPEHHPQAH